MRNKNDLKLDIISNIDEDIIDKNLQKRFDLWKNKKAPSRKKYIPILSVAACLFIIFGSVIFVLLSGIDGKQVPIYRGMTASTAPVVTAEAYNDLGIRTLSLGNDILNIKKNDLTQDSLSTPENADLNVSSPNATFYAQQGQSFYITVHIDNPDNFEIVSFTLNGKKYSSYMFESGSNMENLILKCDPGQEIGLVEYTIDAIKYIDGEEIKDVEIGGDKTIKVAIFSPEFKASAQIDDKIRSYDSFSFSAVITDIHERIKASNGTVSAYLYSDNGKTLVNSKSIAVNEKNTVLFEGLTPATSYTCTIEAEYDMLDGLGFRQITLAKFEFYTNTLFMSQNLEVSHHGVSFDFVWHQNAIENRIISMALYKGQEKIKDVDVNTTELKDLFANTEYTLKIEYVDKGISYNDEINFVTEAYTAELNIADASASFDKISFELIETDNNDLGYIKSIELKHYDEVVEKAGDVSVRSFSGLFSNTLYTVSVTYVFDLKDGKGEQIKTINKSIKTDALTAPSLQVLVKNIAIDYVIFDIQETDPDNISKITSLELWYESLTGKQLMSRTTDESIRSFVNIPSGCEYTIKVNYEYNLNQGPDEKDTVITSTSNPFWLNSNSYRPSAVTFTDTGYTKDSIRFDFSINKIDSNFVSTKISAIELWCDGELIEETTDTTVRSFSGLEGAGSYTVKLKYVCDLRDGLGQVTRTASRDIITQSIGLEIDPETGYVSGIGNCTDSVLYINAPINSEAFKYNTSIKEIHLGSKVGLIGSYAFYGCYYLEGLYFHGNGGINTNVHIYEFAFADCKNLTKIQIPNYHSTIELEVFWGCDNLSEIHMKSIEDWLNMGFYDPWEGRRSINEQVDFYLNGTIITDVVIPANVTHIGACHFSGYSKLKSVSFEEGSNIQVIGQSAFSNCINLTSITIPKSMVSIDSHAFYGCKELTKVIFEKDNKIKTIGDECFAFCDKLESIDLSNCTHLTIGAGVFYRCKSLSNVVLPPNTVNITRNCFGYCDSLKSITLPKKVTIIQGSAFIYCGNLIEIIYSGSKADWNAMIKEDDWDFGMGEYTVTCTDGTLTKSEAS